MPNTEEKYTRASRLYDLFEKPIEKILFSRNRKKAIPFTYGNILEVGVGTGKNLPLYDPKSTVTGIDFSPGMLNRAKERLKQLELKQCELKEMDAQNMTFSIEHFDSVLSTFVFCTVPDPHKGLAEVNRVLKKGGKAIFLEHMKSKNPLINMFLHMMNLFSLPVLGTSMTRETKKNIESAGFEIIEEDHRFFDVVRLIVAVKK